MRSFIYKFKNKTESSIHSPQPQSNVVEIPPVPYYTYPMGSENGKVEQNDKVRYTTICSSNLCHMGRGTYPRATRLHDGSILGTYTAFNSGKSIIATTKSIDDGLRWTPFGEITRGFGDIDNPFLIQLENGDILCAFRNHSRNSRGIYAHFRITICISQDGGRGWQYLSTAEESVDQMKGLWEPFMRLARDGSIQLYYSRENSNNDQDLIQRLSYDRGVTWSSEISISGHGILVRDGMLGVLEWEDELIAVFETDEEGPMHIKLVTSADDGKSWGNRQLVYRASQGIAAAPQIANCGGVLIVSFQTNEDGNGTCVKIISGSPGHWENKMSVGPVGGDSTWAGIIALDNGNALVMFDSGGCKTRRITLQRRSEEYQGKEYRPDTL